MLSSTWSEHTYLYDKQNAIRQANQLQVNPWHSSCPLPFLQGGAHEPTTTNSCRAGPCFVQLPYFIFSTAAPTVLSHKSVQGAFASHKRPHSELGALVCLKISFEPNTGMANFWRRIHFSFFIVLKLCNMLNLCYNLLFIVEGVAV